MAWKIRKGPKVHESECTYNNSCFFNSPTTKNDTKPESFHVSEPVRMNWVNEWEHINANSYSYEWQCQLQDTFPPIHLQQSVLHSFPHQLRNQGSHSLHISLLPFSVAFLPRTILLPNQLAELKTSMYKVKITWKAHPCFTKTTNCTY